MKNPPIVQAGSSLDFAWTFLAGIGTRGSLSMGASDFQCGESMLVRFEDLAYNNVAAKLLGYSFADGDVLRRIIPFRHPIWHWSYCSRIAGVRFLQADGKEVFDEGPHMNFAWAVLDLVFSTPNYRVLTDNQIGQLALFEWDRFVERTVKSRTNAIQRLQGEFSFREGDPTDLEVPFGPSQLLFKTPIQWLWHDVPESWLLDNVTKLPTNVFAARGHVNQSDFAGFPAGTLLMEDPEIRPRMLPIPPEDINLGVFEPPRSFDVLLNFLYFDPPPGGTIRGHNTLPWTVDGLWYVVADNGNNFLYPETEFPMIFDVAN